MVNERLEKILNVLDNSKKTLSLTELVELTKYSKGCIYWFLKNDVYGIKKCGYDPIVYYTKDDIVTQEEMNKKKPKKKRITRRSKPKKVIGLIETIYCNARGRNISSEICIPNKNHDGCNLCKMICVRQDLAVA